MRTVLITGGAGFIGSNLADMLLNKGFRVIAIDNFDDYYDTAIKKQHISNALQNQAYTFIEHDINDIDGFIHMIPRNTDCVFHLAARAGVRHSIQNPAGYLETNVTGTEKIAQLANKLQIPRLIFTSSSSVYGNNQNQPWYESSETSPMSPYAMTKLQAEEYLQRFASQADIRIVVMRLFSVYGRRMRPDLMMNRIYNSIMHRKPLPVFGDGSSERDYTYIDDILNGLISGMNYDRSQYEVFNLGSNQPVKLSGIINIFEKLLEQKAIIEYKPAIEGESVCTFAGIQKAESLLSYKPSTGIEKGIELFIDWKHNN